MSKVVLSMGDFKMLVIVDINYTVPCPSLAHAKNYALMLKTGKTNR